MTVGHPLLYMPRMRSARSPSRFHARCSSSTLVTVGSGSVVHAPFLLSNLRLPWASQSIAHHGVLSYPVADDVALCWAAPDDLGRLIALVIDHDLYGSTINAGT